MKLTAFFLPFLFAMAAAQAQDPLVIPGKVSSVTLYRGQAGVMREVPLPARSGILEVVVPDMPPSLTPDSLYAEAPSGSETEIRAVRFRTRSVGSAPREEVRALDEAMALVRDAQMANTMSQTVVNKRLAYLDQLETFVATTAHADIAKGALDAESLERMVRFSFEQRNTAQAELLTLVREAQSLAERLALLEKQRAEISTSSSKIAREAVIFLEKTRPGPVTITLHYIVRDCGWTPSYNLRADTSRGLVQLEYAAVIQQVTGEDWSGVDFTLSTATPGLSAGGPALAPFRVSLTGSRGPVQAESAEAASTTYKNLFRQQLAANEQLRDAVAQDDNFVSNWNVNVAANQIGCFELTAGTEVLSKVMTERGDVTGPSLSYHLDVPVSLASRNDQQMVRILRKDLGATFYHVASPVLTSHVFREAEVQNLTGSDLLAGNVGVYLDSRFVGRAELSSVAQGERFVVGLGADPRLRTHRELKGKREKIQGANRVVDLDIALSVENFHDRPITVRLMDRLPHSAAETMLRLTRREMSHPLSQDATYVRLESQLGILRFDLEVPATSVAEQSTVVTYGYTIEHDRNVTLTSAVDGGEGQVRQEFERLLRSRGVR